MKNNNNKKNRQRMKPVQAFVVDLDAYSRDIGSMWFCHDAHAFLHPNMNARRISLRESASRSRSVARQVFGLLWPKAPEEVYQESKRSGWVISIMGTREVKLLVVFLGGSKDNPTRKLGAISREALRQVDYESFFPTFAIQTLVRTPFARRLAKEAGCSPPDLRPLEDPADSTRKNRPCWVRFHAGKIIGCRKD